MGTETSSWIETEAERQKGVEGFWEKRKGRGKGQNKPLATVAGSETEAEVEKSTKTMRLK